MSNINRRLSAVCREKARVAGIVFKRVRSVKRCKETGKCVFIFSHLNNCSVKPTASS